MADAKVSVIPDDPIATWVVTRFNESKNYYQPLFDKFEDWDEQYFSIATAQKYSWMSNVFVPATYKAVKTLLARIVAALFSVNPPFDVIGVEEKDRAGEIPKKNLTAYQFDKTEVYNKFILFVLQALIRGTSVGKVFWDKQLAYIPRDVEYEEEVPQAVDENGKPIQEGKIKSVLKKIGIIEPKKIKKTKTVYDEKILYEGPNFEVLDINGGIFPDPYATNFKDGYMIHRVIRTEDYLRKNKNKYDNIDTALNTEYPGDDEWHHSRLSNLGLVEPEIRVKPNSEDTESKTDKALKKYEILECHTLFDINNDGKLEDAILTVCNRQVVIKKRVNNYPDGCFVKIGFMPVLDEFFWQGVCELVENLQTELNDKTNQRLDNVNLCLQKILVFVEDAVDTKVLQNFVFAPGKKLAVKDLNAIKWESPEDVTASSYNETNLLRQEIQETSGAVNVLMPTSGQSDIHRTASGLFMLKGEAETSIKLIVQMIENMGLAEIAKKYDSLNKLFMTKAQTVRILGEQGAYSYPTVSPEDIRYYNCDYVFKGASAYVNREIRLAQLSKFMDMFVKIPALAMQFDWGRIAKTVANILGFSEDEVLKKQVNPLSQGMGMEQPGMGGMPGNIGNPQGNPDLQNMVNQQLPLDQISGIMEKLQQQTQM